MFLSTVLLSESQRQLHISDYDNALEETEFCVCVGGGGWCINLRKNNEYVEHWLCHSHCIRCRSYKNNTIIKILRLPLSLHSSKIRQKMYFNSKNKICKCRKWEILWSKMSHRNLDVILLGIESDGGYASFDGIVRESVWEAENKWRKPFEYLVKSGRGCFCRLYSSPFTTMSLLQKANMHALN